MSKNHQSPLILAIDTSCDDTSAAVTVGVTVLSNVIASQTELHRPYGGVYPTVAKQAHRENLGPTIHLALQRARAGWDQIQAIAVTQGPGLAPALEVGLARAHRLATYHQLPLIAINHIEAHALSPLAERRHRPPRPTIISWKKQLSQHHFPVLAMVISGGHTEFIKCTQIGTYERLGFTIDDAAGEALDKVGRMLDLGYPAGPVMEQFARNGDEYQYAVPLPMTNREDFNMSFSGLKTWARNKIEELETQNQLGKQDIYDLTASFQFGVFQHICYKLNKLLSKHQIQEVWLGGGVAANIYLRRMIRETLRSYNKRSNQSQPNPKLNPKPKLKLKLKPKPKLFTPYSKRLCMDNAAMIGIVGGYKFHQPNLVTQIENLDRRPRWEISATNDATSVG